MSGDAMPATLAEALLQVARAVGYVQKDTSRGLNYSYAGEATLIAALRPHMVAAGIVGPIPVGVELNTAEHAPTKRGARQFRSDVVATFRFLHVSGEHLDVQVAGSGIDVGDKSTPKAVTGAYKYALRQTFCIETGDDPDRHPSGEQEAPTDPADAPHDAEWDNDRVRFCSRLTGLNLSYDHVRDHMLARGDGKPSTWGTQGRAAFVRDLLAGKLPDLYKPESGA